MVNQFGQLSIYMPTYADNRRALLGSIVYCITSSILRFLLFFLIISGVFVRLYLSCSANMSLSENKVHLYPIPSYSIHWSMTMFPIQMIILGHIQPLFGVPFSAQGKLCDVIITTATVAIRDVGTPSREWMGLGVAGMTMTSYCGSFPNIPC